MCWRTARPFAADVDKQQSDSVLCHFRFGADAAVNSEASSRSVGEHNVGMTRGRELSESCPADAECDTDSDGVCDGSDSCRGDADNDADGDGVLHLAWRVRRVGS